jgi:hypothetical protein
LIANLYMNRFLKYWHQTGRGEAWQAHVINYADDFVILSRGHAAEALAWADRTMTRLGLTLNRTKTRLCDARTDRFDFLGDRAREGGYSFGLHRIRQDGRRYIGASPSAKSVQRLKEKVGAILVPGNMGRWEDVCAQLTRLLGGGAATSAQGPTTSRTGQSRHTPMTACVTSSSDATRCPREASGRSRWRRYSANLECRDRAIADDKTSCREPTVKPVGKPDAGNPHVRFDERGGETGRANDTAPFLDSTGSPAGLRVEKSLA